MNSEKLKLVKSILETATDDLEFNHDGNEDVVEIKTINKNQFFIRDALKDIYAHIEELERTGSVLAELEAWLEAERLECETWKRGRAIGKTYWLFLKRMIDKIKELKEKNESLLYKI